MNEPSRPEPRLMFLVGGYEIGFLDGTFYARSREPQTFTEWYGTRPVEPWRQIEDGEIATDLKSGCRITKPLRLGEAMPA